MQDKARLVFLVPSRGLLGYRSQIKTDTRGSAVLNSIFHEYQEVKGGQANALVKGKLISGADGTATAYALGSLEERGELFISPGVEVYTGRRRDSL